MFLVRERMESQNVVRPACGRRSRAGCGARNGRIRRVKVKARPTAVIDGVCHDGAVEVCTAVEHHRSIGCVENGVAAGTTFHRNGSRSCVIDLKI